jgi:hypothetical protein
MLIIQETLNVQRRSTAVTQVDSSVESKEHCHNGIKWMKLQNGTINVRLQKNGHLRLNTQSQMKPMKLTLLIVLQFVTGLIIVPMHTINTNQDTEIYHKTYGELCLFPRTNGCGIGVITTGSRYIAISWLAVVEFILQPVIGVVYTTALLLQINNVSQQVLHANIR